MDHGLKPISFYVQKLVVAMGMCYNPALVHDKSLGVPISAIFEIALSTLVDIRSTNELTFGGPALILVDRRNMQ